MEKRLTKKDVRFMRIATFMIYSAGVKNYYFIKSGRLFCLYISFGYDLISQKPPLKYRVSSKESFPVLDDSTNTQLPGSSSS